MGSVSYNVYNSAADLPPFLNQTDDCGICLGSINEPPPIDEEELVAPAPASRSAHVYLQNLCGDCAQTSEGAPLSTEEAAVVSHTDAKGMDRTHFRCLRNHFLTAPQDSTCVTCREPVDTSTLLTKTEAASVQFRRAAKQRADAIMRSTQQWMSEGTYRLVGGDKGYGYRAFCFAHGAVVWISAAWAGYTVGSAVLGSKPILEWPTHEIACLIVGASVGVYLSRYLFQPLKHEPIKEPSTICPSVSALPQGLGVQGTDLCSLCEEPLQRVPHVPLERPCEGSLKGRGGKTICEASVAVHFRTSGHSIYHLPCARKQLHQDILAQTGAATIFQQKTDGLALLTSEEGIAAMLIEHREQREVFARRFHDFAKHYVPAMIADTLFSGVFLILRGIARGEWTRANTLSDLAFVTTCVSLAHVGTALGFGAYSKWAQSRGQWV